MKLLFLITLLPASLAVAAESRQVLLCGWDEVYVLDITEPASPKKTFTWKAQDRPELPASFKDKFRTTDDCKVVAGNRILVTASSDGVALIDRSTSKTLFWGLCANAHSAELLPGERIAAACSVRQQGGNRLAIFDAAVPEKELYSTELYSGHGAIWDSGRKLLWALSGRELRAYSLIAWESQKPSLKLEAAYPLPSSGGHELSVIAGSPSLIVSATRDTWIFDRDKHTFTPHHGLKGMANIKSAVVHPGTGQLAFTQAESPNWWTSKIQFLNPAQTIVREGERLYKVRWVQ